MMDTDRLKELTGTTTLDQPLVSAQEFSVADARSTRPLWAKPIPKFAMAALMLFPVVAIAGVFLTGGGRSQQSQPTVQGTVEQPPTNSGAGPDATEATMQGEIARLKAKSALDGQAQLAQQLTQQPAQKPGKTAEPKPPTATNKAAPIAPQARVPTASTQPVVIRSQPPKIATAPVSRPAVTPKHESKSRAQPVDPQAAWQTLAQLGSYGAVRPETLQEPEWSDAEPKSAPPATLTTWEQPDGIVVPTAEQDRPQDPPQPASLLAGTKAAAVVETPLVLDEQPSNEQFTIVLSEAIPDATGQPVIPANAKLLVQVDQVSQTGRVQLTATSITWKQAGQTQEMTLPAGAMQIRGEQGQPLVAQAVDDQQRARLEREQVVLSGIRGATGQLIQPNSRVAIGNGSTVITQDSQQPNILAGVLHDSVNTLLNTITERNQRNLETIQQRAPMRYIAAGTTVQVFVNQSVQLPR